MDIDTKHVNGRRTLRFETMDDLLKDAESIAGTDVHMLGNWSLGQILSHLAMTITGSIDGFPFAAPLPVRMLLRMTMKKKMLTQTMPSGFKIPAKGAPMIPGNTSTEEGLAALRAAVTRYTQEPGRAPNPGFGRLTEQEWLQFHLRHAEGHMRFAVPKNA